MELKTQNTQRSILSNLLPFTEDEATTFNFSHFLRRLFQRQSASLERKMIIDKLLSELNHAHFRPT